MKKFSPGFLAVVVGIYAAILAPLCIVILVSFSPTISFSIPFDGVSLRWYSAFFSSAMFLNALFLVSLPIALTASVISVLIGTLSAVALVRMSFGKKAIIETTFMLPLFVPSILLGAALYLTFARLHFAGNMVTLIIGHTLLGIPYVIRVVTAGLVGINPYLEEAAMSLGCSRPRAFVRVVLPLLRSSILSGGIFAFIISFSDINLALFLSGPNTATLPLQIYSEIVWQGDPTIAAASTVQVVLVCLLIFFAQKVFRVRLAF